MFDLKVKTIQNIEWIKPLAYLEGDLDGVKLLVQLPNKQFAFLLPPNYEISNEVTDYIFEDAVLKYNYKLIEGHYILYNQEELNVFLKWILYSRS